MSTTTEHPDRNLAAEVRAVEEGHRAYLARDARGPFLRVVSDTKPGKAYRVTAHASAGSGRPLVITCQPIGATDGHDHHTVTSTDGIAPCKHAAVALRRLERHGLAAYAPGYIDQANDRVGCSRWVATITAETASAANRPVTDDDPFAGFPST